MISLDIEMIKKAEQALAQAHVKMDLAAFENLLHADYTILQPDGRIETKQEVLDSYRTGNRRWNRADVSELEVAIYGETGRVSGIWSASGINNGEEFDYQARFLSVWVKEVGLWKNFAYASTEIFSA